MLINGLELNSLGIKLYDRVISSNTVDTTQEWLDGDIQPTSIRQQDRFKNISVSFLILSPNEEEAFLKISKLTSLLKKATIQFDDLDLLFDVSLVGSSEPTRLKNGNFIVNYTLTSDYAKGEREVYTTNANMTNSFKLTVVYYQNSNTLLATEAITIRASSFNGVDDSLESIGIDTNKYQPQYFNYGVATNLNGLELNYENLQNLGALIINYAPIVYSVDVHYYMNNGNGYYTEILNAPASFTYNQVKNAKSIGQIIDAKSYKPDGYRAKIDFDKELTIENLLAMSPISVFYDKIEVEKSKNVVVNYLVENDNGEFDTAHVAILNLKESSFVEGMSLNDVINVEAYRPEGIYYNKGYFDGHNGADLITYDLLETAYNIHYTRATNTIFVEYYVGTYPNWYRLTTTTLATKYKNIYETNFDIISDLNLDLDKYHTATYEKGALFNGDIYNTYESVLNAGVLQIFYKPIDYPIVVQYYKGSETGDLLAEEELTINELMFLNNPVLGDIIPITAHRPEGYQFSELYSYAGEVSLSALTQASPIYIVYEEIVELKTKNIIVRYKKELASAYSTINTSLITVNEADTVGGVRLKDIINLNLYQPEFYEPGVVDGASSSALLTFDTLGSSYDVLYVASTYTTSVRYYTDDVDDLNWIGSSTISYRVIDFTTSTTLYDLGLNLNAFKPSYCDDGVLQYTGPVNFTALRELSSIDIVYDTVQEPEDDSGIDYPHRFLYLQHNDLGDYEHLHPEWTLNHAFINTGVSVDDMSKLTVIMEVERVDENVPLHEVNAGYAYLFGSYSSLGSFYMRFNNQTQYGSNLTGINTYEAKAGYRSNSLAQTEEAAIGFGPNSGIYASAQDGYSRVVFTYSNNLQTDGAQMPYPLYLFANNKAGSYEGGIAGVGIYSCRIYYNNELIRDMIPVQFYDKIGDQIAPSNCLYDKVSKTFFEDGTGLNSFNIRDDDRYEDTNLEHKIGHCYVNYYKGDALFQTSTIWFRASDFEDGAWDPYEKFAVDYYQPSYYKPGEVLLEDGFIINFDNLNNRIFSVSYAEEANQIVVNYYKENSDGDRQLIKEEIIPISEKDFYQVPTFGDIVRLNKYKPEGYETDFVYEGKRVSLSRVLELSPYTIVYKPIADEIKEYTTVIRYMKKVFGLRNYEVIGTKTLTFNQSDFRDGEYIDFYIDFNELKPEKYYLDGEPYEWYRMDERITSPEMLKDIYTVYFMPETQFIDINYYTDEVNEDKLIASTSWSFDIDDWEGAIQLVDTLPNNFINKYKPVNCSGGQLINPEMWYTFEDLVNLPEISIVYTTIIEPNDPETASYEQKVLYWDVKGNGAPVGSNDMLKVLDQIGGRIPYIDLGYKPKEIGRLRVEAKAHVVGLGYVPGLDGNGANSSYASMSFGSWGGANLEYATFFGYVGPQHVKNGERYVLGETYTNSVGDKFDLGYYGDGYTTMSRGSRGAFCLRARIPVVGGWVRTAEGPQVFDGITWYTGAMSAGQIGGNITTPYTGIIGHYRRGDFKVLGDNYEEVDAFKNYAFSEALRWNSGWTSCLGRTGQMGEIVNDAIGIDKATFTGPRLGNPYTVILDAYNNYAELYTENNSNTSWQINFGNDDNDIFEVREQPQGSLTLFQSTNPTTGKVNIMPFNPVYYPSIDPSGTGIGLQNSALGNPYENDAYGSITTQTTVITGYTPQGTPIYETKTQVQNINYAKFPLPSYPQMSGCYIWRLKIWDRDRLVRDLIPVAEGDRIFDYVMPANGLFDLITEIFFGNSNEGGEYSWQDSFPDENGKLGIALKKKTITADEIIPLQVMYDPTIYGKITNNYYDYDNSFIANQYVNVPTWFNSNNEKLENILQFNDYKPDDFHLDGMIDLDADLSFETLTLKQLYEMGLANIYYKLRTFTKTVVYYQGDCRIASKDLFYSLEDIEKAKTIADLGIDVDLYYDEKFAHGRVVFDESIIAQDDIQSFIDAPSPIVVYDKLSHEEAPDLLYLEYYRGGAYDDNLITIDEESPNYLDCDLDGVVLNPNGAIKYYNHYHSALYEDEVFDYFIPYQVRVINKYTGIHRGPARRYQTLAMIVKEDTYTIIEERNGWGRLKEYPVGWILLNATEPITGPGQNPDYDVAGSEIATIGFGERVHITKLTIDRLWCYVPEAQSWVKAEDISYDQAGKLYNGLDIKVIDLSTIDFANVSSLEDMGIYPEAKVLRFHDYTNYVYEGEYSYDIFSALHNIHFVYPETIYNYTCIYYKDNRADANELGRAAFSCSMSDWNPDWDVFIETSWRIDENGDPINPTIYRDTDLTLTWDYFGFDKNLFRPAGYPDGIYMWNPRSWDEENISFSFEEMVRTGTQYVFYPTVSPNTYKLVATPNTVATYYVDYQNQYRYPYYISNPGIKIPVNTNRYDYFGMWDGSENLSTDIHFHGEIPNRENPIWLKKESGDTTSFTARPTTNFYPHSSIQEVNYGGSFSVLNIPGTANSTWGYYIPGFQMTDVSSNSAAYNFVKANVKGDNDFILNMSNYRTSPSTVIGFGNVYEGRPINYYIITDEGTTIKNLPEKIEYNTNIKNYRRIPSTKPTYRSGANRDNIIPFDGIKLEAQYHKGVIHNVKVYEDFLLNRYWIPVPKGMWYMFNGETLRMPDNGMFDICSGEFVKGWKIGDGDLSYEDGAYSKTNIADGEILIFLRNQEIVKEGAFNYFDEWFYNTQDIDYIVKLIKDEKTYVQPDEYATEVRTLTNGLVMPVSKLTADADNRVVGEWYFGSDQWVKTSATEIYAGTFDKLKLSKLQQQVCLLPSEDLTSFYVYLDPSSVENVGQSSNFSYGNTAKTLTVFYNYTDTKNEKFYFDGAYWVPEKYTSNNIVELNKNFAITKNTTYYSFPIESDEYKVGTYLYGERISIPHVAANDTNWGYTGRGWIKILGNTSEIL